METIIEMMIREKIASNQWQASHISEGLQLHLCHTREEQVKRCKLYRDWRNAGEDSATAYRRARNGDPVPQSLFDGVLHSEQPMICTRCGASYLEHQVGLWDHSFTGPLGV